MSTANPIPKPKEQVAMLPTLPTLELSRLVRNELKTSKCGCGGCCSPCRKHVREMIELSPDDRHEVIHTAELDLVSLVLVSLVPEE